MKLTDLDRVIETVECLAHGEFWVEGDTVRRRCPLCACSPKQGHRPDCIVPEALTLLRKMRERAVEGWAVEAQDGIGFRRAGSQWTGSSGSKVTPALLLITPEDE